MLNRGEEGASEGRRFQWGWEPDIPEDVVNDIAATTNGVETDRSDEILHER